MTGSSTRGIRTVLDPVPDLAKAREVDAALLGARPQTGTVTDRDGNVILGPLQDR